MSERKWVLVVAAPVLQDFHSGEKVGVGVGGIAPCPPGSYGPGRCDIYIYIYIYIYRQWSK